jgi:hypothetical protein
VASKDISSKCNESKRISPKLRSSSCTPSTPGEGATATVLAAVSIFGLLGVRLKDGSLFSREDGVRCTTVGEGKASSTGVVGPEEEEDSVESVLDGPLEVRDPLGRVGVEDEGMIGKDGSASRFPETIDSFDAEKRLRTEKRRRLTLVVGEGERKEVREDARGVFSRSSGSSSSSVSGYGTKPCISVDEGGSCIGIYRGLEDVSRTGDGGIGSPRDSSEERE